MLPNIKTMEQILNKLAKQYAKNFNLNDRPEENINSDSSPNCSWSKY